MSYDLERFAIATFADAQSNFGLSPFGLDMEAHDASDGSGYMTILPGQGRVASTGSPGANFHEYVSVLSITMTHIGGQGSRSARQAADVVIAAFTGRKLDEAGGAPSGSSSLVIDFGRNGLAPYISSVRTEGRFLRTVVNAPFVRTERK